MTFTTVLLYSYYQNVDLHGTDKQVLGGSSIIKPLADNMGVIYNLSMLLLLFMAIAVSLRIFSRWQNGEESNVIAAITRWFGGIILSFCLITFLKIYVEKQNFGGTTTPVIPEKTTLIITPIN